MKDDTCCAPAKRCMILACSGGSNVGQLSNQAAVELTKEGFGSMYCLAGIGGAISGFVQSAKDVDEMVVIDGCPIGCAREVLKQQGVTERNYLVVTDLGFVKAKKLYLNPKDIQKVKDEVRKMLGPETVRPADDACCSDRDGGKC
ncbi:MAG TPA: putative zinc-binding protein [Bacteroidales bacterium]|nr:MAG: DGC domain protein [Deltaproteobacteria bacterium ADurb.Bin072]HPA69698.1 putative zinc-binding protein [Bacteroidales bacterium]HPO41037.1 putative zinc-binding protein [Bacteroidales bacterium]